MQGWHVDTSRHLPLMLLEVQAQSHQCMAFSLTISHGQDLRNFVFTCACSAKQAHTAALHIWEPIPLCRPCEHMHETEFEVEQHCCQADGFIHAVHQIW